MTIVSDRPAPAPDVTPALEVGDTLEIVITLADIAQGKRKRSHFCALSLALQRAGYLLPTVGYSEVSYSEVRAGYRRAIFNHTAESKAWVRAFDSGDPVAPERFVLHRRITA